jgi:hypothetical protein
MKYKCGYYKLRYRLETKKQSHKFSSASFVLVFLFLFCSHFLICLSLSFCTLFFPIFVLSLLRYLLLTLSHFSYFLYLIPFFLSSSYLTFALPASVSVCALQVYAVGLFGRREREWCHRVPVYGQQETSGQRHHGP